MALAVAAGQVRQGPGAWPWRRSPNVDARLVAANTGFALRLLQQLAAESPDRNVFFSPMTVAQGLHTLTSGSRAATREALVSALSIAEIDANELPRANRALRRRLEEAHRDVEIVLASSFWHAEDVPLARPFVAASHKFYGATCTALDFRRPDARDQIDAWVEKVTARRIHGLGMSEFPPGAALVMVNAAYFRGTWALPFSPEHTSYDRDFHLPDGRKKRIPMMQQTEDVDYLGGEGFGAVRLMYGPGRFAFSIFLPDYGSNVETLCERLTLADWRRWQTQFSPTELRLCVPRFRVEWSSSLTRALHALGMGVAFDRQHADFTPMTRSGDQVWVDDAVHTTWLRVDEEGTEAAAVQSLVMALGIEPEPPTEFIVDRPFLCTITDNATGTILFIGVILDPTPAWRSGGE